MNRVHIVLQAYGTDEIRVQGLYAAWSALAHAGDLPLSVHVYTDDATPFAPLAGAVDVRVLSRDEIRAWRGPLDFTHRLKAIMIREMCARFPEEKLLYLDADVFFVSAVAPVFERITETSSVMHEREYPVATHPTAQMRKFRKHLGRLTFRGRPVDLGGDMWNAGAVGLHPSRFGLVDDWIAFIDELYPQYQRGLVEQYGVGIHLQRATTVSPCQAEVFHYWAQKDEYVAAIRRELEVLGTRPLAEANAHLRANRITLPPKPRKEHGRSLMERLRRAVGIRREP
jgi:hypothetical protein